VNPKPLRISQTNKINLKKYQPKKKEKNMQENTLKTKNKIDDDDDLYHPDVPF
jgi:hypothetical protein